MNILLVGNSFSVDVATYVHQIAEAANKKIDIYVLYIGGCPIKLHYENLKSGAKAYEFYKNGCNTPIMWCSIQDGLNYKKWDYITFQQRSPDSGDETSFYPELGLLMDEIRKYSKAKYALHMTWSYAKNHSHEKYGSNPLNQEAMDLDIFKTYENVSKKMNVKQIIPSGKAIYETRKVFGDICNRDGYHLSELGRTVTSYLWAFYFLGIDIDVSKFKPSGYSYDQNSGPVNEKDLPKLIEIAKKTIIENKGHNLND